MSSKQNDLLLRTDLYILLALALKPRHGYAIAQQIGIDSQERIRLGPGTLYAVVKRLDKENYIEEIPFTDQVRRRVYRLTKKGWDHLLIEMRSLEHAVLLAKERHIF